MADAPEKIGRYEGYGPDDIRYTQPPLFITGQTNYIRADLVDELVKALETFRDYGCPVCHGDCASANPPVNSCPMQMAKAALTRIKGDGK